MNDHSSPSGEARRHYADLKGYRAARLAVYRLPLAPDIRRGLALEDAVLSIERASMAVVDANVGEPDEDRKAALREAYIDIRCALIVLKKLNGDRVSA